MLRLLEKILVGAGLEVVTASDGLDAIEKAFGQDVSLIILDVMMPRMNGYQACRLLKTEPSTRAIPVVILTSKDQAGDRFWGLETGADYYLTKDSEPQRIVDLVRNIIAGDEGRPRARPAAAAKASADVLARVNELLDRKLYEATILSEIGRVARSIVEYDETVTSVMGVVARIADFTLGALAFLDGDDLDLVLVTQRQVAPAVIEEARTRLRDAVTRERKAPVVHVRVKQLMAGTGGGGQESELGGFASFPITTGGRLSGMLGLGGRAVTRLNAETMAFLGQVANQAHIVVENSRLVERLRNLAVRDSLTGLYNHRHTIELLAKEFARARRYENGLSAVMMDVDHFKSVNDKHGHQTGDFVLREIARILGDAVRSSDAVGRYGGEEFLAILPHTRRDEALLMAERMRRSVEEHVFSAWERELRLTLSLGVATFPADGIDSAEALIREADRALYAAKEAGRNRVG